MAYPPTLSSSLTDASDVQSPKFISVIVATYNQPEWLTKVLWGYACQTLSNFQVVVADDGSDDRTTEAIELIRNRTHLKIEHVWHEDDGFRKCETLNQAIVRSSGDYLIFSDGDCVPGNTFVANHHQFAEHDRFLSGGSFKLPNAISRNLTIDDICSGRAFDWNFLRCQGLPWSRRYFRFAAGRYFAALLNRTTTTKPTWNARNSSCWKDDLLAVNGFDERMTYGGLDRELGERLTNAGVKGKHIRYNTITIHLDDARERANPADWIRNHQIRQTVWHEKRTWTDYGIQKTVGEVTERLRRAA